MGMYERCMMIHMERFDGREEGWVVRACVNHGSLAG